jgi:hypothetical protein
MIEPVMMEFLHEDRLRKKNKKIKYKRADCIGMLETAPVVLANSIAARVGRLATVRPTTLAKHGRIYE